MEAKPTKETGLLAKVRVSAPSRTVALTPEISVLDTTSPDLCSSFRGSKWSPKVRVVTVVRFVPRSLVLVVVVRTRPPLPVSVIEYSSVPMA
jgi:hypothetical protein